MFRRDSVIFIRDIWSQTEFNSSLSPSSYAFLLSSIRNPPNKISIDTYMGLMFRYTIYILHRPIQLISRIRVPMYSQPYKQAYLPVFRSFFSPLFLTTCCVSSVFLFAVSPSRLVGLLLLTRYFLPSFFTSHAALSSLYLFSLPFLFPTQRYPC